MDIEVKERLHAMGIPTPEKLQAGDVRILDQAMEILMGELDKDDLSAEQRAGLHQRVVELVAEGRKESHETREFCLKVGKVAIVVAALGVGATVLVVSGPVGRGALAAGGKMAVKSLGKLMA